MFEKEAEGYADKYVTEGVDELKRKVIKGHWQDGAEFGYNKAKEDADRMKSRFLELCNLKDVRIAELEKANEWHYPSKGELPKKTGRFLILNRFGEHYFTTNVTEYLEGAKMFSCFSMKDVYAWKEIVLPELKENE